jgi:Flp pilus assembly protein TadG
MRYREWINLISLQIASLCRSSRANVAIIVALSIVPVIVAAGAGMDLARGVVVRSNLASALDAAGLAVGATSGLSQSQMQTLAQQYFNANYTVDPAFGVPGPVTVTFGTNTISLSDQVPMPTTLLNVVGLSTVNVGYTSQVTWGQTKLWVAMVLDNTGSMTQSSNGLTKMAALKTASTNLLSTLQGAAQNPGDVEVSIIPFTTDVNIGTSFSSATWIDWSNWSSQGDIEWGWTCGSQYNLLAKTMVCGSSNHTTWSGCVMDRDQPYDTQNTTPTSGNTQTYFAADQAYYPGQLDPNMCPEAMIGPTDVLNSNGFAALNAEIAGMVANGATNQTIGLALGWQAFTQGAPFNAPALPQNTNFVVIMVTDGLNTKNRWSGDGSDQDTAADAREAIVCSNLKAAGAIIYTVYVDLPGTNVGDPTILENCASGPNYYFDLTSSGEIISTLNSIGTQITQLRVSK